MQLAFGALRLLDLRDARGIYPEKYHLVGRARIMHRAAKVLCCLAAAIPLLQLNGRVAEIMFEQHVSAMAPYEVCGT
jgi:hypothetical protein